MYADTLLGTRWTHRRVWFGLVWSILIGLLIAVALPARAAEQVDALPFVNNFATARFKLLSTFEFGDQKAVAYGAGEAVLPDRSSAWIGSDASPELSYVIQIGTTVYQRTGNGKWERTNNSPMGDLQAQPLSAQFNELQKRANAILNYGNENVGNVPTTRYQVWLRGDRLLGLADNGLANVPVETRDLLSKIVVKYDFWIGTQDSFLHQQNIVVTLPETTEGDVTVPALSISTLSTFYDINDPNISVNPPI
ncbi:MAG: hypothetical protein U0Z44_04635 [Kouleothrix sp.]|nr:hypothetical protein [Kouleothrix sp.]